ncbi:Uncharacterized protein Fot_14937 [Forsythia ovata]|uniref:Uncharacterized protein n=1 Tax=Forsythia ovata TaxID=205694 RepID=A0ABD1W7T4_9LAMI
MHQSFALLGLLVVEIGVFLNKRFRMYDREWDDEKRQRAEPKRRHQDVKVVGDHLASMRNTEATIVRKFSLPAVDGLDKISRFHTLSCRPSSTVEELSSSQEGLNMDKTLLSFIEKLKNTEIIETNVWAFEAIPNLGKKFAKKYADGIPRMLAWELSKRLMSSELVNVLEAKEEVYWKELTPCVEEEDTDSQDSKENETEHDGSGISTTTGLS